MTHVAMQIETVRLCPVSGYRAVCLIGVCDNGEKLCAQRMSDVKSPVFRWAELCLIPREHPVRQVTQPPFHSKG